MGCPLVNGLDELLSAGSGFLNHQFKPAPATCECGVQQAWSWWEGRELPAIPGARGRRGRSAVQVRGRWLKPRVNPCPTCADSAHPAQEVETARALQRLQETAGLPMDAWPFRWELCAEPPPGERLDAWQSSVQSLRRTTFGIFAMNAESLEDIRYWRPEVGKGSCLVVHGPVGTSKTTAVSMLATELLMDSMQPKLTDQPIPVSPLRRAARPDREVRRQDYMVRRGLDRAWARVPTHSVKYIREEELLERQKHFRSSWNERTTPLQELCKASVVILDDGMPTLKPKGESVSVIRRLIDNRVETQRHLIITSNEPFHRWVDPRSCPYGLRVADRLWRMCSGHAGDVAMVGPSWRRQATRGAR